MEEKEKKENPHDVRLGDIYQDMDTGRPQRLLKVVEIEDGAARLLNTKTERLTRVRLDRLGMRAFVKNSHGYMLVERAPADGSAEGSVDAGEETHPDAEARP